MVQVPMYNGPKVRQNAMPQERLHPKSYPSAMGGGENLMVFGAAQDMAGQAEKIYAEEKRKADQVNVLDAANKLEALSTGLMHDPKSGALNTLNPDAVADLPNSIGSVWKAGVKEIEKTIKSPDAALAFKRMVGGKWADMNDAMQRHMSRVFKKRDDDQTEMFIDNMTNAAIESREEPAKVGMYLGQLRGALEDYASRNTVPPGWAEDQFNKRSSAIHEQAVSALVHTQQEDKAQEYYDTYKDQLVGAAGDKVKATVMEGTVFATGRKLGDEAFEGSATLDEALSKIRARGDLSPRALEVAENRAQERERQRVYAKRQDEDAALNEALQAVEANPHVTFEEAIPKVVRDRLNPSDSGMVRRRIDGVTDPKSWSEFVLMDDEKRGNLSETDMARYRMVFSRTQADQATKMWHSSQKALAKGGNARSSQATIAAAATNLARQLELQSIAGGDDAAKARLASWVQNAVSVIDEFEATELKGQRKASPKEINDQLEKTLLRMVVWDRNWPLANTKIPAAYVRPEDELLMSDEVTQMLREKLGATYTPARARKYYLALKMGRSDRYLDSIVMGE